MVKKCILPIILFVVFLFFPAKMFVFAETATPSASQVEDIKQRIKDLESKLTDIRGQEKTLSLQIQTMDNNTKLTQMRIESTKSEIENLQKNIGIAQDKIGKMENSLTSVSQLLLKRIQAGYTANAAHDSLSTFVDSSSVNDFILAQQYINLVQEHDRKLIYEVQQTKNNYQNQKDIFAANEQKQKALQVNLIDYTKQLETQKAQKTTLLSQTQGSEANYQRLLEQAEAQLAGFSNFTANQGGAGLLSGQTKCDDWGCYYNQRDISWGGMSLNGTKYTLASDGCLVTSMAMVISHYGHRITPVAINSNPANFASYYPAYMLFTTYVDGITAQRISSNIDVPLSKGDPVIVGVHAYGGTHFVVLKSGSKGNYIMHDPYISNGHDVSFTDHYSVGSIFEIDKVQIQ